MMIKLIMKNQLIWWRQMVNLSLIHTEEMKQGSCEKERDKLIANIKIAAPNSRDIDFVESCKIATKLASLPCLITDIKALNDLLVIVTGFGLSNTQLRKKLVDSFMAIDQKNFQVSTFNMIKLELRVQSHL